MTSILDSSCGLRGNADHASYSAEYYGARRSAPRCPRLSPLRTGRQAGNMATKHRRIRGGDSEPAVSARDSRARLRHRREWQDHRNHRIRCRARLRKRFIYHLDSAADRFGHQDRHRRRCAAARRGRQTRPRPTGAPICSKPQAARRRAHQASADSHVGRPSMSTARLDTRCSKM
jgi:hypothetical protein